MLVTRDLLGTLVRTTKLWPLVGGGALGMLVVLVPIMAGANLSFVDATSVIRFAMVAILIGAAFLLDDEALPVTEVLPISGRTTMLLRMLLGLPLVTFFWATALWLAPYAVRSSASYSRQGLVVEIYALLAWVWFAAILSHRRRSGSVGGATAAPALLVGCVVLTLLPDALACFVSPRSEGYGASRVRWVVLLLVGTASLTSVMTRRSLRRC